MVTDSRVHALVQGKIQRGTHTQMRPACARPHAPTSNKADVMNWHGEVEGTKKTTNHQEAAGRQAGGFCSGVHLCISKKYKGRRQEI